MDEDLRRGRAGRGAQLITGRGEHAGKDTARAENHLVDAQGLRRQPLHELQGRMGVIMESSRKSTLSRIEELGVGVS